VAITALNPSRADDVSHWSVIDVALCAQLVDHVLFGTDTASGSLWVHRPSLAWRKWDSTAGSPTLQCRTVLNGVVGDRPDVAGSVSKAADRLDRGVWEWQGG
jgi:hypothetical protein